MWGLGDAAARRLVPGQCWGAWRAVPWRLGAACLAVPLLIGAAAPLGAGAKAAAPAVDWSHPQVMRVEMVDYRFVPDHLTFRHGVTYRLHLENHGKDMHEFTAPAFFAEAVVRDPRKLANGGQEVVVQPGQTADIDLVLKRTGHYDLRCADHDWDGMVGSIEVR